VNEFRKKFNSKILVETGTYLGEMIYDHLWNFDKIYSIELSDYYYRIAMKRFKKFSHVSVLFGDSSILLESVLQKINSSALYWLDGHYSGGKTAKGDVVTPLLKELAIIIGQTQQPLILIDDARYILDKENSDYPNMDDISKIISQSNKNLKCELNGDIICIYAN
jgi:hypothetical protein